MSTLTPVAPSVIGAAPTTILPTASDTIPCAAYRWVLLIVRTGGTNTYAGTVDDPTSVAPAGTGVTFNPDVSTGTVATSSAKALRLDCARFRDVNGNITITSSSTFTGTTLEAYGIE